MIDIDLAVEEYKNKENISDGGSNCYDFGDTVLVKYTCPIKYLGRSLQTREMSEEIMESLKEKTSKGVNTPKHLAVKRVVEGEDDVCYVLQEKCPGYNCASKYKYHASYEEACESLKSVLEIPFEHYQKLIADGCQLYEMGYEAKNKNLFYDKDTGFWYIDFLNNDTDNLFDKNDIKKIFIAVNHRIPKPIQLASQMDYGVEASLEPDKLKKIKELKYAIKAKTFLAIKSTFPIFSKYEKFFLINESDEYKNYLMKEGIINKNLLTIEPSDYEVFNELREIVINGLVDKVVNKGVSFWSVECNDIRNDSNLFNLESFFTLSDYNKFNKEDFEDEYDYKIAISNLYKQGIWTDLVAKLSAMDKTENITAFLNDANEKLAKMTEKGKHY